MTLSPKHLSFDEMWQLYKTIKNGIKGKEFLIDEIMEILNKLTSYEYSKSLHILYGEALDLSKMNPIDSVSLFIDGLTKNNFFDFCKFVTGIYK